MKMGCVYKLQRNNNNHLRNPVLVLFYLSFCLLLLIFNLIKFPAIFRLELTCLKLDGGRVNTLGNSHQIKYPKIYPRYWMKIIISWRLLPSSLENNYIIFHCSICEKLRKASKKVNIKGAKKLWAILKNTMYSCGFKNIDNNVADITWDKRIILVDITSVLRFCHSFLFSRRRKYYTLLSQKYAWEG